ncbi:hypothetical protein [Sphingomonas sp.]|uniref:hypothetical protein n=1 Tax=Sphingomonas sp. TaxID=28214 RepID=UPI002DE9B459|nr:hypothetical protein [Sphingomonas sp.]
MRKIISAIASTAAALGAAAAASAAPLPPEERLARLLEGRVAGKPVNCINNINFTSAEIIDGTAIVYRVGSKLYVNRPRSGADSLDQDDIMVSRPFGSQLCSVDVVDLIDRGARFQTGFVMLGEFVPYTRVKR